MKKLRQGRRVGRHLYIQEGPEPADTDPPVGMVDTPELAARIVEAVNDADGKLVDMAAEAARLRAAVARIRELHKPFALPEEVATCYGCDENYPCTTIRILEDQ